MAILYSTNLRTGIDYLGTNRASIYMRGGRRPAHLINQSGKFKIRIYEAGAGVKTWFCADGWHTARKEVAARVLA